MVSFIFRKKKFCWKFFSPKKSQKSQNHVLSHFKQFSSGNKFKLVKTLQNKYFTILWWVGFIFRKARFWKFFKIQKFLSRKVFFRCWWFFLQNSQTSAENKTAKFYTNRMYSLEHMPSYGAINAMYWFLSCMTSVLIMYCVYKKHIILI